MTKESLKVLVQVAEFVQTTGKLTLEEATKVYEAVLEAKAELLAPETFSAPPTIEENKEG